MCGIAGVIGKSNISDKLFRCIKNLEYRGYDSCGVAILADQQIEIRKNVGSVDEVNQLEDLTEPQGKLGLAHTRWATHGGVTQVNSHPHTSGDRQFAVIHNGIISNYRELKKELSEKGHEFQTETDTEVIPHVLEDCYAETGDVEKAMRKAFGRLKGTYAFAFVTPHAPQQVFCARKESPLVIGVGSDNMFLASDINSFIEYTRDIVLLNDDEYAIIRDDSYTVKDVKSGEQIYRKVQHITWNAAAAKKGGFPTFMLKEIHEQPSTVRTALNIDQEEIRQLAQMIHEQQRSYLVGVGTTYYVSLVGHYYFSSVAKTFLPVLSSDEFEYSAEVDKNTLFVCCSQSGETYDTLKALRFAKAGGAKSAAVVNVVGSSISREVDLSIMQSSGPEICVLSTKAAISQMVVLLRTAIELGRINGRLSDAQYQQYQMDMQELPDAIQWIMNRRLGHIRELANAHSHIRNWLFLGRGIYMAAAMEGALKMKEVTYQHAEGMGGGFMKHGTISLIDDDMYTLMFVPPTSQEELYEATMSNVEEVKARGGFVLGLHFGESDSKFDAEVTFPDVPPLLAPLLEIIAAQLFAYYSAVKLGRNIDKPRSLAKSVTVA
ncbi:glutamine--fructose-6-phosphate transaminase (isomerizing) [candidate division KSB3 bacterium]|uniref:Glutamine--fructose-6-phosphate aminotransferase [isomerizing] n=1 Tax=candidate division KSB3 bacterium TaxID=2044937 RepID=A0A2G6KMF6_9BACT|nr:MAG: glutamine--fructose-6-phosphate transaminase (isomerizing) [candidate division KSB3 bacterium]